MSFATNLLESRPYCHARKKKCESWKWFATLINNCSPFEDYNAIDIDNVTKKLIRCSPSAPGCFKDSFRSPHFCQIVDEIKRTYNDFVAQLASEKKKRKLKKRRNPIETVRSMKRNTHHQLLVLVEINMTRERFRWQKKKKSEKPEKKVDDVDEFARSLAGWADVEKEKAAFEIQKEREIHELQLQQKRIEIEVQTLYLLLMKR
jgi:hypothetical protein